EIHSMSMEFFTEPWMEKFFGDRADDYRVYHLADAVTFIPYGCMVDEFQHIIYENPDLTPAERRAEWVKLEKQYRPHMDYGDNEYYLSGGFWQRQLHIYELPFYYIDYCLAQTVALEYKAWMEKDYKEAWNSYLEFCKQGARDFYSKSLPKVGLKVPFEKGCLDEMVEILEKAMEL
ncbi:MAG: M3 family oligoendopeptidase, partial [Lachnospiraceae bacterium]|nr:M3 family oligoendopeptidase [Lachnospiraceae bacterium]